MDKEKVILMTKLAKYEQNEGKKYLPVAGYFKFDYISLQLLKSFLAGTIVFVAIAGIFVFYKFEYVMGQIYNVDIIQVVKKIVTAYIIAMVIYLLLSSVFALIRYKKAEKSLKYYYDNLGKLQEYYE